jgi:methanogenic corrinoid protein MtbC1
MSDEIGPRPSPDELRARLESALARRDRLAAIETAVGVVRDGAISIPDLYVGVLSPLLAEMGAAWAHGTERVWEEHFASHAVRTIIETLYLDVQREVAGIAKRGERVLLACPPKEQHELGLRMLSDRFELAGYDVTFLGADTPLDDISSAARATNADIVALSVSTVFERVELRAFVDCLRDQLPGVRIVIGGPAFSRDRHWPEAELLDVRELGLPGSPAAG